jgi:threonine aldolase
MLPVTPQRVRAVTHLDVSREDVQRAVSALKDVL